MAVKSWTLQAWQSVAVKAGSKKTTMLMAAMPSTHSPSNSKLAPYATLSVTVQSSSPVRTAKPATSL
jgi:hypothetical protein